MENEASGKECTLAAALVAAALLACGGSVDRVSGPQGQDALEIKCKQDRADCLAEAGDACGAAGYHILSEDAHSGGVAADILPGPVPWWTMTVACGQPRDGYQPPPVAAASVTPLPANAFAPPSRGPQVLEGEPRCSSDYECGVGARCAKDSGALQGICAKVVNEYGTPVYGAPRDGYGAGDGQCSFNTDCPIGFRCVKTSGGLRGNCMK